MERMKESNMGKEKGFYKNFFSIYIALVLQNVVTLSVNLADNIMLGSYSETALAGAARVMEYSSRLQRMFVGLGIFAGALLFLLRVPILSLYDLSPGTKAMDNFFLIILSVVCCLNADQIFKCIPGYLMSHYGNWIKKLTRDTV